MGARAFLVFADLQAGTAEAFALALDALGATAPARPGAWLLRGRR